MYRRLQRPPAVFYEESFNMEQARIRVENLLTQGHAKRQSAALKKRKLLLN